MKKETISEMTREQLGDSLIKLIGEKPLEKISIKEITSDCGFPRSTFYYHFEDIYDLAAWALAERTVQCLRDGGDGEVLLWGESLLELFNVTKDNYRALRSIVNSSNFWRISDKYCTYCVNAISPELAKTIPEAAEADPEYLRFLTTFYGHSMLDVCVKWFRGDMSSTPEEMVALLDAIIKDNFLENLRMVNARDDIKVPLQIQKQNLHSAS